MWVFSEARGGPLARAPAAGALAFDITERAAANGG
jgi:hypothetical protein